MTPSITRMQLLLADLSLHAVLLLLVIVVVVVTHYARRRHLNQRLDFLERLLLAPPRASRRQPPDWSDE